MVERIDIESNSSTEVAFDEIKIKIYGRTKQIWIMIKYKDTTWMRRDRRNL